MTDPQCEIAIRAYGESYTGQRKQNEDRFVIVEPADIALRNQRGCLYLVCDGMGGHAAGQVASNIAAEVIADTYHAASPADAPADSLCQAIRRASERIYAAAEENPAYEEMGCTIVACLILANQAWIAHVGDSRAYRWRQDKLERLTRDHLYVIDTLGLDDEAARHHHLKHRLSRAVGVQPEVKVDVTMVTLDPGDRLLLCTDGLSNTVAEEVILSQLRQNDPTNAIDRLFSIARKLEAEDNTTAIAIYYGDAEVAPHLTTQADDAKPETLETVFGVPNRAPKQPPINGAKSVKETPPPHHAHGLQRIMRFLRGNRP
jgi:serine/threonine protein phosphatase PrpC